MSRNKSKPDQWLPLYVADYLADTTRFSTEQHGAYFLLILDYWRNGPPPDDDTTIAQITKLALAKWRAMRPVIAPKFQVSGGVWKHKRIEIELAKARKMQAALSERGKVGAEARWGNREDDDDATGNALGNATGDATGMQQGLPEGMPESMPNPMLADAPSPSSLPSSFTEVPAPPPSPSPAPERASARKRAAPAKTRLPDGFSISERVRRWAQEKGFSRLDEHLESFAGKCRAKGYTYADWDEGFMGAIRDDWAGLRNGKSRNGNGSHEAATEEARRRIFGGAEPATEKDVTDEAQRL